MTVLISLLIVVLVLGLIYFAVMQMGLPEPFQTAARFIVLIVFIIVLLSLLTGTWTPRWAFLG